MTTSYTTAGVTVHHWPRSVRPAQVAIAVRYNTSSFASPFTRTTQTTELPGALHTATVDAPALAPAAARDARAFLASLRGQAGRFVLGVYPCRYAPPGAGGADRNTTIPLTADFTTLTGDTTLVTADATTIRLETTFTVTSAPNSTTLHGTLWANSARAPLQVGSYLSFDDASGWRHLHTVTAMTHTVSTGAAVLTVAPPMRALPGPSTPMHVHAPSGIFMLTGDDAAVLRPDGTRHSLTVDAVQAHPLQVTA